MNTPTYKEQFDKITGAYFRNELDPMRDCACFVGNLLNGNRNWSAVRGWDCNIPTKNEMLKNGYVSYAGHWFSYGRNSILGESGGLYSPEDIVVLEKNFLSIYIDGGKTEDSLFAAMDSTLDMLRKIHESKGEVIEPIPFKKRELVAA